MKTYLLIALCIILVGCSRQEESQREVIARLDSIESRLTNSAAPVRWATAKKSEIMAVIYQWNRDKMEQFKKAEALPPETEAKILEYDALRRELSQMRMPMPPIRTLRLIPGPASPPEPPKPSVASADEYEALSKRVAEAKAPVATIVDRRERQEKQYREQYSSESLIAECVKDRYDLVVDTSDERYRSPFLYRTTAEVPDITVGVIALFKQKTTQ